MNNGERNFPRPPDGDGRTDDHDATFSTEDCEEETSEETKDDEKEAHAANSSEAYCAALDRDAQTLDDQAKALREISERFRGR